MKTKNKNNTTELVFILDRSGSMAGLENDTIGGFNAMIEKQKKEDGEATLLLITSLARIISKPALFMASTV